jgi:hypothetical protein
MTVREAAELLAERAAARGLRGHVIPAEEMRKVLEALGGAYPAWLADLLTTVPLSGLELGWQEFEPEPDYDGRSWLFWSDARNIVMESSVWYPGLAILPAGYVNVASCSMGSGDPFFINAHDSVDPPLYRVYHDIGRKAESILRGGRILVASRLSEFLANALLEGDSVPA